MEKQIVNVGVLGASSYTGRELVGKLLRHPNVKVEWLTSESQKGVSFEDVYPQFRGELPEASEVLRSYEAVENTKPDVVFSCLPHGVSAKFLGSFLKNGHTKVIDLSADFRLQNIDLYKRVYDVEHPHPDFVPQAQYGLCELFEPSIKSANPIGNPGCYPTSILLPLLPLLAEKSILPHSIIADAKSGVSGAGKGHTAATHFGNSNESFSAYKIGDQHRHLSEIKEQLEGVAGEPVDVLFTPHLVPMERGILSTIYAERSPDVEPEVLRGILEDAYQHSPFVFVVPNAPATRDVKGTNKCYIYLYQPLGTQKVILVSVIDNLLKGASGQALQNMNILFDLPEEAGLLS